ncbi:MAG: hypothetical protein JNL21_25855 [Myxococcales bacterium]|nr:hypothetical protein [Myxococcales bacterium]
MSVFVAIVGGLACLCWLSAFVHWLMLVGHRKPDVSLARMVLSGMAAFNQDNFLPSGHPLQRRMVLSMLAFFLVAVAGALVGAMLGA